MSVSNSGSLQTKAMLKNPIAGGIDWGSFHAKLLSSSLWMVIGSLKGGLSSAIF